MAGSFALVKDDFEMSACHFLIINWHVASADDLGVLLYWVKPAVVAKLSNECRDNLARHILTYSKAHLTPNEKDLAMNLPIFKQLKSTEKSLGSTLM